MNESFAFDFGSLNARKERKNRQRLEIVKDILSAAQVKAKKTRIMYQANLSYRLMEKYLQDLLGSNLVTCDDDANYTITWRGKEFLQMYGSLLERCQKAGDEIFKIRRDRLSLESMCSNKSKVVHIKERGESKDETQPER